MDELGALFPPARGARSRGAYASAPARRASDHVLFSMDDDENDDDVLVMQAKADDGASMFSFADDVEARPRSRASSMGKGDAWDYTDAVRLRPMGSSKVIEADDDGGALSPSAAPAASTRRAAAAAAAVQAAAPREHTPRTPTTWELLQSDARWQLAALWQRVRREVRALRGQSAPETHRTVEIFGTHEYTTNQVMTNKYNPVTFVPYFLVEQFSKYANVFFLFIGCLQQIPGVSPTNRWTTLVPLALVLLVAAAKELSEDWKRYTSDVAMNARLVAVLDGGHWVPRAWRDVRVGDVVRVARDEFFPADLLLLASSEPEGLAYVETANLDGETNLKVKQALPATAPLTSGATIGRLRGTLACEAPNNSLYTFDGTLTLAGQPPRPAGPDQLLLRGAQLRNAMWAYGLVVYTGHDTKLLQNATATPVKRTGVERQVNSLILHLFGLLLALALVSAIGAQMWNAHAPAYLLPALDLRSGARQYVESVLTYIILYNSLLPISLIVSMDVVKLQLAALIHSDLDLYFAPNDTPAQCRRSTLVEDLGQIEYIFSDKTGTLTRNEMEFQQASIAGRAWAERAADAPGDDALAWRDLDGVLAGGDAYAAAVGAFLTLLAVCHTVIPEEQDGRTVYQASSPDEAALVAGAAKLGFCFTTRKPRYVYVDVRGETRTYEVLQVCEFTSARKRMSTLLREPSGRVMLYCKGADTVVLPRAGGAHVDATVAHLEAYASEGLRTLCIAAREVPAAEYAAWAQRYEAAAAQLDGRAAALAALADEIERDLELLGATAIEDKLQDGVPDTIATLQDAGIRVWVLTGDRLETAVNIGYACRLLTETMNLLLLNEPTAGDTASALAAHLETVAAHPDAASELALVVEGASLEHALAPALSAQFLELACRCKAVLCCRVSPLQKARVVELVKASTAATLLAIGDGANDVGMIQAAHVGVGLSGHEGLQAARSADVTLAQFRFLKKLLLVHGQWSYARLSKMVLYSFYKTMTLYVTLFWYSFYNGFTGQAAYESWSQSFYNVIFTMLPTLVIGILDQYVGAASLERYPALYRAPFFTREAIAGWLGNAVFHSMLNFFVVSYLFQDDALQADGYNGYQWLWGTTLYFTVLVTVLGKAALVSNLWTRYTLLAIPGSLALTLLFVAVFGTIAPHFGVSME